MDHHSGLVHQLKKVTLSYSLDHDRIQLLGLDDAEKLVTLWLTRRLTINLLNHFEASEVGGASARNPAPSEIDTPHNADEPVAISDTDAVVSTFLVTAIDITQAEDAMSFVFRDQADVNMTPVRLLLTSAACETWVKGLRTLCLEIRWIVADSSDTHADMADNARPASTTIH